MNEVEISTWLIFPQMEALEWYDALNEVIAKRWRRIWKRRKKKFCDIWFFFCRLSTDSDLSVRYQSS